MNNTLRCVENMLIIHFISQGFRKILNLVNPIPDKASLETKCAINGFPIFMDIPITVAHCMRIPVIWQSLGPLSKQCARKKKKKKEEKAIYLVIHHLKLEIKLKRSSILAQYQRTSFSWIFCNHHYVPNTHIHRAHNISRRSSRSTSFIVQ